MEEHQASDDLQEPSLEVSKPCIESPLNPPFFMIERLSHNVMMPCISSRCSVGYELSSALEAKVPARGMTIIPTDISIVTPEGTYARIAPIPELGSKYFIGIGAGVIDAKCRRPVEVVFFNNSDVDFEIKFGDHIALMIIEKIMIPEVVEVDDLDPTIRGSGGFGSTGM